MARRKRIIKRMKKPRRLRKKARPKRAKPPPRGFQYRTLVAILMLLFILKLIDEKTFNRMAGSPHPKRAVKKRRRRRRAR